jgi:uroporphyrinogen III methyltransferase/synthase
VLLACAKDAREVLANGLSAKGWRVVVVEAYRTLRPVLDEDILQSVAGCDVVTFASSSAVTGYLELAGRGRVPPVVACIGPITARSAAEAGLTVQIVAREHTAAGLVDALVEWQANRAGADERQ